ncbi:MAG: DUF6492 family protein [Lachnospiraceae bacterium]|nr:DUF6492 family protein [Lachnospiraceae bacterium]
MKENAYECLLFALEEDYLRARASLRDLYDMLMPSKMKVVGPAGLEKYVLEDARKTGLGEKLIFLDETTLLSFDAVKEAYENRIREAAALYQWKESAVRTGWYYQQFLKMAYCRHCSQEYYLCWDIDTLPLRPISMIHANGKPIFDVKWEYIPYYFEMIGDLLGIGRCIEQSFISEHMLFRAEFMKAMLEEIERRDLPGDHFYEKIISCIKHPRMGFSEFETYGCWVASHHPEAYVIRDWKSIRNTNFLIDRNDVNEEDIAFLASGFYAASFEKYQKTVGFLQELFRNPRYREKLTADILYQELLEEEIFGDYNGRSLIKGDCLMAT